MYIGIIAPTLERKHSPTKQRFELYHHVNTLSEVLSHLFDHESDIEENVSEPEDGVEEDPDYEVSSSDENETLSVDPPVVSQPPANTLPSKNGKVLWSVSPLEQQGRLHHHHHPH